jgi:hypothetical protein
MPLTSRKRRRPVNRGSLTLAARKESMTKRSRRILLWILTPIILIVIVIAALGAMLKSTPGYYRPLRPDSAGFADAAKRVEDKLIDLRNAAMEHQAARARGQTQPRRMIITLTQDELNAFVLKWAELNALRAQYEAFIDSPMIVFSENAVTFAAEAKQPTRCVVSLHAGIELDAGKLKLSLDGIYAGRIPVPSTFWDKQLDQLRDELNDELPKWLAKAQIDPVKGANESAIKAAYARLLLSMLAGETSEPVLIIPVSDNRGVPVKVDVLRINDGKLELTATPLSTEEITQFLTRLSR